jgi:hypothetical protein
MPLVAEQTGEELELSHLQSLDPGRAGELGHASELLPYPVPSTYHDHHVPTWVSTIEITILHQHTCVCAHTHSVHCFSVSYSDLPLDQSSVLSPKPSAEISAWVFRHTFFFF